MPPLSPRRARFVQEYLIDLDAPAAAARAGYRIQHKAPYPYQLLRAPEVAAAVRRGMDERARRLEIDADRIVRELAAVAFSDIRRIVTWTSAPPRAAGGPRRYRVRLRDSAELDDASAAAIAALWPRKHGPPTVRLHDKLTALGLLARHIGLFGPAREGRAGEPPADPADDWQVRVFAAISPQARAELRAAIEATAEGQNLPPAAQMRARLI